MQWLCTFFKLCKYFVDKYVYFCFGLPCSFCIWKNNHLSWWRTVQDNIIVGRGLITFYLMKTPYIAYLCLFFYLSLPSTPAFLLPCFFGRMFNCTTFNVLFCFTDMRTCTCQALVTKYQNHLAICFKQQDSRFTIDLTQMTWLLLALWFDTIHTNKYTQSTYSDQ